MRTRTLRLLSIVTLTAILLTSIPWPPAPPPEAHAQGVPNAVIGFIRFIGALRRRNRVYREARVTQRDMDAYYDALHDTAAQQLIDNELMGTGELSTENRTRTRVYIRLQASLRAEQQAVTAQIEAEKNQARQEFNRNIGRQLVQILVQSPGGQQIIGDLRRTVGELRNLAAGLQSAIANNRPFDLIAQEFAGMAGDISILRNAAYNLGQRVGQKLDQLLGGAISRLDRAMGQAQSELGEAIGEIDEIDGELASLQTTERTPVSLVEEGGPLGEIRPVNRATAAVDAAAEAYTNVALVAAAIENPTEAQRGTMRDRIRQGLLEGRLDRLNQAGQRASHVSCTGVSQAQYQTAMAQLGSPPEQPLDPSTARYLVCRDPATDTVIYAALIGGSAEKATEIAEGQAEETEAVAPTVPVQPPPEDRCSLSGEGDFIIENLSIGSHSSTCEDLAYPFDMPAEPLLLIMAAGGKWTIVEESPVATTWAWQATQPTEGAVITGKAVDNGSTLDIDVEIRSVPTSSTNPLQPANANGYALLALLPLFPLSLRLNSRRRRRWVLLAIGVLALLLTAQSCDVQGTFSGSYSFPIPEEGFPCEVDPENPNLAEMPASSGQVVIQLIVTDEDETASCEITAHPSGLGVLKRDGFYSEIPSGE